MTPDEVLLIKGWDSLDDGGRQADCAGVPKIERAMTGIQAFSG